jgi:para-nitrobenzyl esterase
VQSGLCGKDGLFQDPSLADAHAAAIAFAKTMKCGESEIAACLRAKPAGALLDAWNAPSGSAYGTALLPRGLPEAFASGRVNRVPLLIGFTRHEWWPFEESLYPLDRAGLRKQFASTFGHRATAVAALYPESQFPHREYALGAAVGDSMIVCPALHAAAALSVRMPVSVYEFDDSTAPEWKSLNPALPGPHPPGYAYGAGHTAELPYLYAYQSSSGPLDATQKRLADAMIARWVAFGRVTPPVWPPYTSAHPVVTRIGGDGSSFTPSTGVGAEHHCDFWNAP